ncbi:Ku protein [Azoarcus olearius]|uniref:Non-homologous end joining protein Ku n=1 Tax=Azoarcus sp. (strain BH72) TaxID=418699 RepID=A1K6A2_AZOSB|nr:Ku protein [Azoarcus olearius]CAL94357.1 conserved hypothetical protein [Azoarcus olearius]
MARVIWKGAVSFGLVHIPVSLVPATTRRGIDFDWLDSRTMDPVGYKRINKATGKEIASEHIVRGVQYQKHQYVVLDDDEIRAAYPEATQTVDIVAFVEAAQVSPLYLDTPYYLTPDRRGEKVYALLREALVATGRAGLAQVVLHTRQRLAMLMPLGPALVLNTLRWADEVRAVEEIGLKPEAVAAKPAAREMEMARRLVEDMSEDWEPARYTDSFEARIMELVERKAAAGKLETVGTVETAEETGGADVIDLAELLKRSLARRGEPETPARPARGRGAAKAAESEAPAAGPRTRRAPARKKTG